MRSVVSVRPVLPFLFMNRLSFVFDFLHVYDNVL